MRVVVAHAPVAVAVVAPTVVAVGWVVEAGVEAESADQPGIVHDVDTHGRIEEIVTRTEHVGNGRHCRVPNDAR